MKLIPLVFTMVGLLGAQAPDPALATLFANYYEDFLRWNPEVATSVGRSEYNDKWSDCSSAARAERLAAEKRYLADLDRFDPAKLNEQDRLSRELLKYQLSQTIETGTPAADASARTTVRLSQPGVQHRRADAGPEREGLREHHRPP